MPILSPIDLLVTERRAFKIVSLILAELHTTDLGRSSASGNVQSFVQKKHVENLKKIVKTTVKILLTSSE
jgi:hypothetical protein